MKILTKVEFDTLIQNSELLKSDRYGPKVYRCHDATYVKLFRQKRFFSLSKLYPYVKRFKKNSLRLESLGIDTVVVGALYNCPDIKRTIVTYKELKGELLRSAFKNEVTSKSIDQLACFIAMLHTKGIYFRSIHLENIVLQPNGKLGLIDIADMRIRKHSLNALRRVRNLCHMIKYKQDLLLLSSAGGNLHYFLNRYLEHAKLGFIQQRLFLLFSHKYIDPGFNLTRD